MDYTVTRIAKGDKAPHKKRAGKKGGRSAMQVKRTAIHAAISALIYAVLYAACCMISNVSSLWYITLLKPSYMPSGVLFIAANLILHVSAAYVFFAALNAKSKNKAQIINLLINGALTVLLFYMFFMLKSSLGSIVLIIVLLSQTATLFFSIIKDDTASVVIIALHITWQVYLLSVIYALLMLN